MASSGSNCIFGFSDTRKSVAEAIRTAAEAMAKANAVMSIEVMERVWNAVFRAGEGTS